MDSMYTQIRKTADTDRINVFVAALVDGTKVKAMGHLVWLWLNSQTLLRTHGSATEIMEWSLGDRSVFDALLKSRYLEPVPGDDTQFRIKGNSGPVARLQRSATSPNPQPVLRADAAHPDGARDASDSSSVAGNVDVSKGGERNVPKPSVVETTNMKSTATLVKPKTRRKANAAKSSLCLTVAPEKTSDDPLIELVPDDTLAEQRRRMPGTFVWMAYRAAYTLRYDGVEPLRNAQVNSQCLALAKAIGLDNAELLVPYYLRREDAFYVNAKHPIGLLLTNAQKLWTEYQNKQEVTMTDARRMEKESSTRASIENYLAEQEGGLQ